MRSHTRTHAKTNVHDFEDMKMVRDHVVKNPPTNTDTNILTHKQICAYTLSLVTSHTHAHV